MFVVDNLHEDVHNFRWYHIDSDDADPHQAATHYVSIIDNMEFGLNWLVLVFARICKITFHPAFSPLSKSSHEGPMTLFGNLISMVSETADREIGGTNSVQQEI